MEEHHSDIDDTAETAIVLDDAMIAELREEGDEFLRELIELFHAETPRRLESLAEALAAQEREPAQRAAHTLKSTAGVFGAEAMVRVAAATEAAARAGQFEEVACLLPALRAAAEQLRLALTVVLNGLASGTP